MENMSSLKPFAEIVHSSLYEWRAHCWEWDLFPSLGSLIKIETTDRVFFGLVYQIETGSLDAQRSPYPYKKTEDELKREHPHIFEFLKTTFSCLPLGYRDVRHPMPFYQIPPDPPKIHAFVSSVDREGVELFFSDARYLHVLFGLSQSLHNLDELLLAMLRNISYNGLLTEQKLLSFTHTFSLLTGNDYRRLKLFLQRASSLITQREI